MFKRKAVLKVTLSFELDADPLIPGGLMEKKA